MRRILFFALLIIGGFFAYWYFNNGDAKEQIAQFWDKIRTSAEKTLTPESNGNQTSSGTSSQLVSSSLSRFDRPGTIRIASWNLDLSQEKQTDAIAIHIANVVSQFDLVAVQGIDPNTLKVPRNVVNQLAEQGQKYELYLSPISSSSGGGHQFGFLYNTRSIAFDRPNSYTVDDPDNLFQYDPFVGWFGAIGSDAQTAFTFTVVNLHLEKFVAEQERNLLGNLYRAVRQDGWREDDVILAGTFHSTPQELEYLNKTYRLQWTTSNPTDVLQTANSQNILLYPAASVEHTGEGGVFDFLREFNLSIEEAESVSKFLPVWTEFRIKEGAESNVAGRKTDFKF